MVVIGGGNTAIDIAVQTKRLGARGRDHRLSPRPGHMSAPARAGFRARPRREDQAWARRSPASARTARAGVEFEYTRMDGDKLDGTGERFTLAADSCSRRSGRPSCEPLANGSQLRRSESAADRSEHGSQDFACQRVGRRRLRSSGTDLTVQAYRTASLAAHAIDRFAS
jgi:glutamate synthase (NADPH/NADH) small chain